MNGILSTLEYNEIGGIAKKIWESGIIQKHVFLYKTKKQINQLHEYKHTKSIVCIIGNLCIEANYAGLFNNSGCFDMIYDVIATYYRNIDHIDLSGLVAKAMWVISNIALDNRYIIERLMNEEFGIYYQVLSIINRKNMPRDIILDGLDLLFCTISEEQPQITLALINLNAIETIADIISEYNLEVCIKLLYSFMKCGEDLMNSKMFDFNIALMKYIELGFMDILENLSVKLSKHQMISDTKKLISQISDFNEKMNNGSLMEIIK